MTTPGSNHLRLLALLLVLVPAASNGADGARKETARGQEKEQTAAASPEKIRAHIEFLSSDELGGRDSGEAGLEVAAEYIANRFRDYGLEPAGDDGSFFQHFTVPQGARFAEQPAVRVTLAGGRQVTWRAATEAEAFGFASSEDNGSAAVDAPLVYAGYGIGVPDGEPEGLTYDDYRGLDVRGKVVLILRFTPRWGEAENPFAAERLTRRHASFAAKLRLAKNHGAAGVIFVTPPGQREDDLYGLARRASPRRPTLPAVVARRAVVERLLERSGNSLSRLVEETDQHLTPRSFLLEGTRVRFATSRRLLRLRNVAG
ncbi:MAG: hypothetical protein O7J95_19005, partial [Planctomycetota bacterium]|nr:hypothetical protein [Planctomycetota bacterium]